MNTYIPHIHYAQVLDPWGKSGKSDVGVFKFLRMAGLGLIGSLMFS